MKTDKQVGARCYSLFNHLQRIADLQIPEIDYEAAIQIPENSFQFHTVAFFHNLRLAALENNFANLLTCCYYESEDLEQFQRLTPFLCSKSHLLCSHTLQPFHQVDEETVLDFFMRFATNFSRDNDLGQFIQFKIIPFMHSFKIHKEEITHLFPQQQRAANQLLH
ncbi:hypothetical protein C8R34_11517 [Nitrosomonas sp. Nm84]|uniref:hypothetical protein n=1 Tax=Nitrosomonas sp. Nm84 TaxID=200124 RepID=UPI000D767840|nr:hypothetical protein [Nitrosomonas sp. Nm84]PXW86119.1 hypothetical protein C8R34_11517 [Nitrosomonas sp. Nm84]